MFEKEAEEWVKGNTEIIDDEELGMECIKEPQAKESYLAGAEFGYNKAREEMQAQEYSMSYENGIFKCKYKSGKEFESIDGKTWKEIVLLK